MYLTENKVNKQKSFFTCRTIISWNFNFEIWVKFAACVQTFNYNMNEF
jgi:hypothetical protein